MLDYIVGIDIGSSNVCAAVGKIDKHGELKILGVTSIQSKGIKNARIVDIEETSKAITECTNQLSRMIDYKIKNLYVSISASICELINNKSLIAITSENNEIGLKDKDRLIQAAKIIELSMDKEIIGVIPDQYLIDGCGGIDDPVGMSGLRLEADINLVVALSTVINNLFKSFEKANLNIKGLVYQPIALSQILLNKQDKSINSAIIDIGGETTNISVFTNGKITKSDCINIGGNAVTNDISVCLKISPSEAEKLKRKYGTLKDKNDEHPEIIQINSPYEGCFEVKYNLLNQIMMARIEEIIYLIYEKLKKVYVYDDISCIIITGGGLAQFDGIKEYATSIFKKHIIIGQPDYVGAASPLYSSAIGTIKDVTMDYNNSFTKENFGDLEEKEIPDIDIDNSTEPNNFIQKIKEFFTELF